MFDENVSRIDFSPSVKGHVSVDVMEQGRVVNHAEHDNYVSPFMYDALRKACNLQFMMLQHVATSSSIGNHTLTQKTMWDFPFNNTLVLTDYAGAVNTRERVIHGNMIGSGQYGYTGTAASVSSFNAEESYQKANSLRFVYDFSTAQGNGTFQSIYSLPTSGTSPTELLPLVSIIGQTNKQYNNGVAYAGGKIWLGSSTGVEEFPLDDYVALQMGNNISTVSHNLANMSSNGRVTSKDEVLYWVKGTSAVYSAPITDLTNVTTRTLSVQNVYSISWSAHRNSWLALVRSGSNYLLNEYSASWELLRSFPSSSSSSSFVIALPEEDSYVVDNDVYDIDTASNSLLKRQPWAYSRTSPNRGGCFIGNLYLAIYYGLRLNIGSQYFSRARLDKPVTKNSRQTMKITYDFNMPAIDWEN